MKRRKRFQFVGLFKRSDDSMVGVVLYRGHRFGLTYRSGALATDAGSELASDRVNGSDVTPAIVADDFIKLGTSMFHYGFSPVDAQGVYHNAAWTESFKRKEETKC
jgi:hypothetical protein